MVHFAHAVVGQPALPEPALVDLLDHDALAVLPAALGGDDGPGTNPEQLFAAGYAACFMSAMGLVAQQNKLKLPEGAKVEAEVGIGPRAEGGFGLEVTLIAHLPGVDDAQGQDLLEKTEQVCPYSNATRGNVKTTLKLG